MYVEKMHAYVARVMPYTALSSSRLDCITLRTFHLQFS